VLVVERDDAVRLVTCRSLEQLGYAVIPAVDVDAARAMVSSMRSPVDLLVTSSPDPEPHGPDLSSVLTELNPELRVIQVSGYGEEAGVQLGSLGPRTMMLRRPFTIEALVAAVRRSMGET